MVHQCDNLKVCVIISPLTVTADNPQAHPLNKFIS